MRNAIWVVPSAASIYAQSCNLVQRREFVQFDSREQVHSFLDANLFLSLSTVPSAFFLSLQYCFVFCIFPKCFEHAIEVSTNQMFNRFHIITAMNHRMKLIPIIVDFNFWPTAHAAHSFLQLLWAENNLLNLSKMAKYMNDFFLKANFSY